MKALLEEPEVTVHHGADTIKMRFALGTPITKVRAQATVQMKIGDRDTAIINGKAGSGNSVVDRNTKTIEFMKPAAERG